MGRHLSGRRRPYGRPGAVERNTCPSRSTPTPRCSNSRARGTPSCRSAGRSASTRRPSCGMPGTRCARHTLRPSRTRGYFTAQECRQSERAAQFDVRDRHLVRASDRLDDAGRSRRVGAWPRDQSRLADAALDAEQAIASLTFHRFNEQALQKSAEAARTTGLADAEAVLKPYIDADAAWARYFLAQIVERTRPAPENAGVRIKSLLEPAAEKGLADAQWSLGTLYLRGAPGVPKDPSLAEALLRRAAERGNPGAAYPARHCATVGCRWHRGQQNRGRAVGPARSGAWVERSAGIA